MTPFASDLRHLRTSRGKLLKEVASDVGVHITHLSALETGRRPPPKDPAFYTRLRACLDLSDDECDLLEERARLSPLFAHLPGKTSQQQAEFLARMINLAPDLQPWQMRAITAILDVGRRIREPSGAGPDRRETEKGRTAIA